MGHLKITKRKHRALRFCHYSPWPQRTLAHAWGLALRRFRRFEQLQALENRFRGIGSRNRARLLLILKIWGGNGMCVKKKSESGCGKREREMWDWYCLRKRVLVLMGFALERFCNGLREMSIRKVSQKPLLQFALSLSQSSQLCSGSFVSHSSLLYAGKQVYPLFLFLSVSPRMTHMPFKLHFSCYSYSIQTNIYIKDFFYFLPRCLTRIFGK